MRWKFWKDPVCAGLNSRGKFRKDPESSGRFRTVAGNSGVGVTSSGGRFRRVAPGSGQFSGEFQQVALCAGVGSGARARVPEAGFGSVQKAPARQP